MKKKSAYRPKGVNPGAWLVAMQGAMLLSKADQLARALKLSNAVDQIARGQAVKADWQIVFDALNMIEEMDRTGRVIQGAQDFVHLTQDVIVEVMGRHVAHGTKALRATELQTLRELQTLWAEVLGVVTHQQYFVAEQRVVERTRRVLAGKPDPHAKIVENVL